MNPATEAILRRRSVRSFSEEPVSREVLEDIVRCGLAAPSSKNAQPSRFFVVTDGLLLDELARFVEEGHNIEEYVPFDPATGQPHPEWSSTVLESAAVLRSARAAIFIENSGAFSRGRQTLVTAAPEALAASIVGYTLEVLGVGAAIQSMWIAAVAHGLAGVFMGDVLIAESRIKTRLEIGGDLVGVLVLGYARGGEPVAERLPDSLSGGRVRWITPPR